jgi:hypothetical protein
MGCRSGSRRRRSSRANRQVLGDREVVVRTAKYSEAGVSCRTDRQVLGLSAVRPLFDDRRLVGPDPGPRRRWSGAGWIKMCGQLK